MKNFGTKSFGFLAIAILALGLGNATKASATNLIVNGDFETPNVGNGWSAFSSITGWNTNGNGIEIDNPTYAFTSGSSAYSGSQSLELNYDYPENVYQTVTGLTVGDTYTLSWAYGDRPDSGDEETQVTFGGATVADDYDLLNGSNANVIWTLNTVSVTATSTSEVLSFNGLDYLGYLNNGGASYGNEIDAVSLVATAPLTATPEPSTWLLMLSGIGMLGFTMLRKQGSFAFSNF